ncbi:MAG: site-specific integrase [Muribaculaceae bacterium]|nr:site-specific integrase [Muribaculaceae bacterium]
MTSIKVKFRSSPSAASGLIFYQITSRRATRLINTGYRVYADEWDERNSALKIRRRSVRMAEQQQIREKICRDVERLYRIVRKLDERGTSYGADDVVREYERMTAECSLFGYMHRIIEGKQRSNHRGTAATYLSALKSFRSFRNGADVMLDSITAELMEEYQAWLLARELLPNTTSFYARILRAVYNRAVDDDITEDRKPFRRVYTGIAKTAKRALPIAAIRKIRNMNLEFDSRLAYARDIFMMSFMLRGMSFVDMAYLRKTDLADGYVTYRRRKTGRRLVIKWTPEMQAILAKYPPNDSEYLLPIINRGNDTSSGYRNAAYRINRNLKKIARLAGLDMALTLYVARHSWASAARSKGVPVSVISEGMGHDSETTTQIYLASLDASVVDRANNLILHSI